jgi:hypothetical protein
MELVYYLKERSRRGLRLDPIHYRSSLREEGAPAESLNGMLENGSQELQPRSRGVGWTSSILHGSREVWRVEQGAAERKRAKLTARGMSR